MDSLRFHLPNTHRFCFYPTTASFLKYERNALFKRLAPRFKIKRKLIILRNHGSTVNNLLISRFTLRKRLNSPLRLLRCFFCLQVFPPRRVFIEPWKKLSVQVLKLVKITLGRVAIEYPPTIGNVNLV